jgi:hypothetical protein
MRVFFLFAFVFIQAVFAPALRAQCLTLADMLAIGAEPGAIGTPTIVTNHLPSDWVYVGPSATVHESAWTFTLNGEPGPAARLQVRAQRPGQDVVLKTSQASCVRELRSELKSRKLASQPVTCPNCEGIRFQGPDFEATIYSQMKGEFPYVVVVHQVPAGSAAPAASTGTAPGKTP